MGYGNVRVHQNREQSLALAILTRHREVISQFVADQAAVRLYNIIADLYYSIVVAKGCPVH
jgi:hypothetical protein